MVAPGSFLRRRAPISPGAGRVGDEKTAAFTLIELLMVIAIIGWGNPSPIDPKAMALWPELGLLPKTHDREWPELRALTRKRHGGQFNLTFCDGHVEGLRPANLFDVRRDDVLKRWNRDNLPHRETLPDLQ